MVLNKLAKYLSENYQKRKKTYFLTSTPAPTGEKYPLLSEQENRLYRILRIPGSQIQLYGPGGTGKTHMARRLFYRLCLDYERLAWVEYGNDMKTALISSFDGFDDVEDVDLRFSKIIRKIAEKPERTILFIDDAKESAVDDDVLARITGLGITIFMTSRCGKIPPYKAYPIDSVSTAECVELFYANNNVDRKRKYVKTVWKLVDLLDRNVFSILLLARVISSERELENYAKRLNAEMRNLEENTTKTQQHIGHLLALSRINPAQKRVLQCFSLMPSGETSPAICEWFNLSLEDVEKLVHKGLIEKNKEGKTYILHDLVREYLQSRGYPDKLFVRFFQYVSRPGFLSKSDLGEEFRYKLDCIDSVLSLCSKQISGYSETALLLGDVYDSLHQYSLALSYYQQALKSAKLQSDVDVDLLINIYWNMGTAPPSSRTEISWPNSQSPLDTAAAALAQAPVPQAMVTPLPRSQTRILSLFLPVFCTNSTFTPPGKAS